MLNIEDKTQTIVAALQDIKALDISVLNTSKLRSMFERMVIASANSTRQTRALADHARTVRVPCHQIGILAAIERIRGELILQLWREPSIEEIAAALGMTIAETRSLRAVGKQPISLNDPIGDEGERALEDFLSERGTTTPGGTPATVVDASKCPATNGTPGVKDDTITFGTSLPESGLYSAFTAILDGENAFLDYTNANGGVTVAGKKYKLVQYPVNPEVPKV